MQNEMSRADHRNQLSLHEQIFRILFNDEIQSKEIVINLQAWFQRHPQAVQMSKLLRQLQQVLSLEQQVLSSEQQVLRCRNLFVEHLRKIKAGEHFPFYDLYFDPELSMFDDSTDDMTYVDFPGDQTMSDASVDSLYTQSSAHNGNVSLRPNCRRWTFDL